MPITEISQLDKAGVITDINEYLLGTEAFTAGYNVRFGNGSVNSVKGYVAFNADKLIEPEETLMSLKGIADKMYVFNDKNLRISTSSTVETIAYPTDWSFGKELYVNPLSNLPVIVNEGMPYYITTVSSGSNQMKLADGWGKNMTARSVVSFKGYLFAFGVTVDSILYEDTVFWSDVAAPDTYPTDWGFNLSSGNINLASPIEGSQGGYNQLSAIGGTLIAAAEFGDNLYLFTESEVFRVSFVGGAFIFKFQKVLTGKGAMSPTSVVALENGLLVIGSNDIYLFNGQSAQSLSSSRINSVLSDKLLVGSDIKLIRDFNEKLVYMFFRSSARGTQTYDFAIMWDWVSNTFSLLDSTYTSFKDLTEYRADSLLSGTSKEWDELTDYEWDEAVKTWQEELKYGTGVMAIRDKQMLILNQGSDIISPEGNQLPVSWSISRKFYTNAFGYPESAIVRILTVKHRGGSNPNLKVMVNGTLGINKLDTAYFRETGKEFELSLFGSGAFALPAYAIEHTLIGSR